MRFEVDALESRLSGDRDERCAVELRIGDAGEEVRRSRAERREAHAGIRGEAAVHIRHERGGLLVPREDELDLLAAIERVVERERLLAGDAEDVAHAFVLETANEKLGGVHEGIHILCAEFARRNRLFLRRRHAHDAHS